MGTVWVFQHLEAEPPGLLESGLRAAGHDVRTFRIDRGALPARITLDCGALIVMGGPMGVYEREKYGWLDPEIELIAGALAAGLPTLGVCLGSQLVAAAAGAKVYPGERPPEIGWGPVRLTPAGAGDSLCGHLADDDDSREAMVFHWHGDTFDLPDGAELLASSQSYPHQAFRLGAQTYGFQFHFEVTGEIIADWLGLWPEEAAAVGLEPASVLEETARRMPALERRAAGLIAAFGALVSGAAETIPA
jgi:GMP synthase (glutamine-hydrolysing)